MSSEKVTGLSDLLQSSETEGQDEAADAADVLLHSIKISFDERDQRLNAQDIEIRMLKSRLATMETFVSYLLEQDPGMKDRMKAMAEAAQKAENG